MIEINPHLLDIHPYIPGKPIEEVQRELGLERIIKLASNENNYGVPKSVQKRLAERIGEVYMYPDGILFRLRRRLGKDLGISPDQVIFGNGSDEILQLIALTYLNPSTEALVSEGTFSEYEFAARLVNAPFKKVALKDFTYDLAALAKAVTKKTKVIFLCNPNNPTGTIFSQSAFDEFMKKIPSNVLVVMDEAYYEYAYGDDYPESVPMLEQYANLLILRTFSKLWSIAGLRLGYGIGSPEIISSLNRARQPFNANRFAEEAALAMLDEADWQTSIRKQNDTQKKMLQDGLRQLGVTTVPSHTNFIFCNLGWPAKEVFQKLLKKGIIIRPMNGFGFPEAIRVGIGRPEENQTFLKVFAEVLDEMKGDI